MVGASEGSTVSSNLAGTSLHYGAPCRRTRSRTVARSDLVVRNRISGSSIEDLAFSQEPYLAQTMIDILSIARDLSEAGVGWAQAHAHATGIAHAVEQQHADIATKEFVRNQISSSETRIIRWTVGTTLGVGALIIAALTLF